MKPHPIRAIGEIRGLLLCALLLLGAGRGAAATLTVTSLADSGPGTLRQLIADASPGDTITFATNGTITLTSGELVINTNLTIQGPGAANLNITASTTGRVLRVSGGSVNLGSLTFSNSHGISAHGGVIFQQGSLTVSNCAITGGNSMFFDGGGIYNSGGMLIVNSSTFSSNSADEGGGIFNLGGTTVVSRCTFSGNSTSSGASGGGAIFTASGRVTVIDSTLHGNSPSGVGRNGCGIYNSGGTVDVRNSIIAGNGPGTPTSADVFGRFVSLGFNLIGRSDNSSGFTNGVNHDLVGMISSQIDPMLGPLQDNGGPTMTHAPALGSLAIDSGNCNGATTDQRGFVRPVDWALRPNAGDGCDMGACEVQTFPPIGPQTVYSPADSGPGTLRQLVADALPGDTIDFFETATVNLTSGEILIDKSLSIIGPGPANLTVRRFGTFSTVGDFRILHITGRTVFLSGLTVANGYLCPDGAGILNAASLTISNITLLGNESRCGYGGGVHNAGMLTVNRCAFLSNAAAGGGIYNSATLFVTDSSFIGNTNGFAGPTFGGGIYNGASGTADVFSCVFFQNGNKDIAGGGIYNLGLLAVKRTSFMTNSGGSCGGGISNGGPGCANIDECSFQGNEANFCEGGAIENVAMMTLTKSTFSGNTAGRGGAIAFSEQTGTGTVSQCTFMGNAAVDAGAIYNRKGDLKVYESILIGNSAEQSIFSDGGGIWNREGKLLVVGSDISGNFAVGSGGAIVSDGSLVVNSSTISTNVALFGSGGGIYSFDLSSSPRDIQVVNTTLSGNFAGNTGGGLWSQGRMTVRSSTIFGNTAGTNGGGIWNGGDLFGDVPPWIGNSIIAGNGVLAGGTGPDCQGVIFSQDFNLIQDTNGCSVKMTNTHNLYGLDPLLGPLQDNGGPTWTHALLPGSPALDRGHSGGLSTDQRGGARAVLTTTHTPPGDGSDIGAFEAGGYVRLTSITRTNGAAHLQFTKDATTEPLPLHHVQRRAAFGMGTWEDLPGPIGSTNTLVPFTDATATNAQNFYRVRVGP